MATGNVVVNKLLEEYNSRLTAVSVTSVLINAGTMLALSGATILLFSILRPTNTQVYAPRYKYSTDEKRPPKLDSGLFSWVRPLLTVKEEVMFDKLGLDATAFLRFSRMVRWMFLVIAGLCCGILIPTNVIYNLREIKSNRRTGLSMLTLADVDGNLLYVHVAVSYLVCATVCAFCWFNYKHMVELRLQYFRSAEYQESLHSRSVMITHVAKPMQSDQGLRNLLGSLQIPYETVGVHIARKYGELPELIEYHSQTVRQLESVLTTYLKNGTIPAKRPTVKIGATMGFGGEKHDAIDYLTAKVQKLEAKIELARENIDLKKAQTYGFASFLKTPYASIVGKKLDRKKYKGTIIKMAPRPQEILWENLSKSDSERRTSSTFGFLLLIAVMVLYVPPLICVSALSNLASLTVYVGFLRKWQEASNITFSAVTGIVPPLLGILLQLILPMIMRALAKYQGHTTHTKVDRAVLSRYYFFLVITNLLLFTLFGVLFQMIAAIIASDDTANFIVKELLLLPKTLQETYVRQSNYWLTFFALRGFSTFFDLAQLISLIYIWFRKTFFGRTPREIREFCAPPNFDYSVYAANLLLMITVALVYAVVAPLVAAFAVVAFFASSFVFKFQLLYIFVTEVESGGKMWRMWINRVLVATVLAQLLVCLTIGLQLRYINAIAAAPPIFAVIIFKVFLSRRFDEQLDWYIPDASEVASSRAHHSDEKKGRLAKRFGHPSLHSTLITPMLHKKVEHLLPQVYSGRLEHQPGKGESDIVSAGGLTFEAVSAMNLELSRDEFLRQQQEDLWETGSMASTALTGARRPRPTSKGTDYFDQQKAQYLQNGPAGTPMMAPMYTNASVSGEVFGYGMERQQSRTSQENLLNRTPAATPPLPQYGRPPSAGNPYSHAPQHSMDSRESIDLAAYTQQAAYPPFYSSPRQNSSEVLQSNAYPPRNQSQQYAPIPTRQSPQMNTSPQMNMSGHRQYSSQESNDGRFAHRGNPSLSSMDSFAAARPYQQDYQGYEPRR